MTFALGTAGTPSPDAFNLALLIMRLSVGLTIAAHGYNHIFRGGKIAGTGRWFESLGMKPGVLHAWLASITELVAGALLVAGLLTPFAAAAVVSVMLVAWITNHMKNGFFIFRPGEGWEYVCFIACTAVALGTIGPGKWSLEDTASYVIRPGSWLAFWITFGLGTLSALGLLAVFWRPEKKAKTTA
jgi:putative oxidoreductase